MYMYMYSICNVTMYNIRNVTFLLPRLCALKAMEDVMLFLKEGGQAAVMRLKFL